MQWAVPENDKRIVDAAGLALAAGAPRRESDELDDAIDIINNWRAAHQFPLNTFQCTLRRKARQFPDVLIAQRVKRLRAIQHKLQKHTKHPIPLTVMQDIGGCRAVVKTLPQLRKLHDDYLKSDLKHDLIHQDDYVTAPRFSGYRGIHLVYSYKSDKQDTYNGLKIEVQLRTQLQHAWATAVEIVGFFRRELLKSSEGDTLWKHFFKLMAADIAFEEKAGFGIPGMPTDRKKVREQIRKCGQKIDALNYLRAIGTGIVSVNEVDVKGGHYFLLELDLTSKQLKVTGYKLNARQRATMDYAAVEKAIFGTDEHDAVLVSADSMADLKRVYVNYFLDMNRFIEVVQAAS